MLPAGSLQGLFANRAPQIEIEHSPRASASRSWRHPLSATRSPVPVPGTAEDGGAMNGAKRAAVAAEATVIAEDEVLIGAEGVT